MLHLLWLYQIQQDSVSDYRIRFLDIAYPGKANSFLWQQGNTASTGTVPFIPWSQGYLLFLLQILAIEKLIDWCTRREFPCCEYPPLFGNAHGFSQFISRPFKSCMCVSVLVYLPRNRGSGNHTVYSSSLVPAIWHECLVLMISLSQHYKALLTCFWLCSGFV